MARRGSDQVPERYRYDAKWFSHLMERHARKMVPVDFQSRGVVLKKNQCRNHPIIAYLMGFHGRFQESSRHRVAASGSDKIDHCERLRNDAMKWLLPANTPGAGIRPQTN